MAVPRIAVLAQHLPPDHAEPVLEAILALRFKTADSLIGQVPGKTDPELREYLENYSLFMQALVSGGQQDYENYIESAATRCNTVRTSKGPGSETMLSFMHLQSSLLNAFHNDYFEAARHYYYAFRNYRNAMRADPEHPDLDRLGAILETINGSVPAEYAWLFRILGLRGSTERGLQELEDLACTGSGSHRLEACLLLAYASRLLDHVAGEGCCPR